MEQDHYAVLDLPRDATQAQIKRRYRDLMRERHPDANAGSAAATRAAARLNLAFETLGDATRRREYDARSANGVRPRGRNGSRRSDRVYAHWAEHENWEDIVAEHVPPPRPRHDHEPEPYLEPAELEIDLSELRIAPRARRRVRVTNPCACTITGDVSTSEPWLWGPVGRFVIGPGQTVEFDVEVIGRKVRFPGLSRVQFVTRDWTGTVPVKITGFETKRRRVVPLADARYVRSAGAAGWGRKR